MLPFSIDRSSRIKLPYQVADGIRSAIYSGFWKPGDRLPSSREIKEELGTSVRAPLEALQMLAKEGLITLREKCGAVVNSVREPLVKGRVLLILPNGAQIRSVSVLYEHISRNLNAAGYLVVTTAVFSKKKFIDGDSDHYDLCQLKSDLKMSYSLVMVYGMPPYNDGILKLLAETEHPFVVVGQARAGFENCVGGIGLDNSEVVNALAEQCRRAQIRRAVVVRKWKGDGDAFCRALRAAKAKVEFMPIPQSQGRGRAESLWNETLAVFERRFASDGKSWLPDLMCFSDDHCFLSAAISMLSHHVRIPCDVKVVTATNAGMRPPFVCSLACVENDLAEQGRIIAQAMLGYLSDGRPVPDGITIGQNYVPGESFP